jgi:cytochrome c
MLLPTIPSSAAVLFLFSTGLPALAGDPAAGALVFKRNCTVCHAVGPGAANKTGPELNGVIGRNAGTVAGYNYSQANKSSGIVWDEATFAKYIADPRGVVPGTKMAFPGIKNEADIGNLIAYLKQFGPEGQPSQ